jgi:hypothetical protein
MPTYRLRMINEHFDQCVELEAPCIESARKKALATAISIAADAVSGGEPFFGAELVITEGANQLSRHIISVGASRLQS